MNLVRVLCAAVLCGLVSACAAIEEENNSPKPIPPARPNPFNDSFGSSVANPDNVAPAAAPVGN